MSKQCSRCQEIKGESEFSKDKSKKDGLRPDCKTCIRDYRQANREAVAERDRRYHEANKEERAEYARQWRKENPEYGQEYNRRYREANLEQLREYDRQRKRPYNPEKQAEYTRRSRKAHPEKVLERKRRWLEANPEKRREWDRRKRAKRAGVTGNHTQAEWLTLCDYYGNKCLACGESKPLTRDHVIPITKGGGNDISNIQPLCKSCNSKKYLQTTDYRIDVP